jgi:hypothetical protein
MADLTARDRIIAAMAGPANIDARRSPRFDGTDPAVHDPDVHGVMAPPPSRWR